MSFSEVRLGVIALLAGGLPAQDAPQTAAEWMQRGVGHHGKQHWEEGRRAFERARELSADNPADAAWANCWIAMCLSPEGRIGEAADLVEAAVKSFGGLDQPPVHRLVQALTIHANYSIQFGDFVEATSATKRALDLLPQNDPGTRMVVMKTLAQCRAAVGDHIQALLDLSTALDLAKRARAHPFYEGQLWYERAYQFFSLGRLEKARGVVDKAVELLTIAENLLTPVRRNVLAGAHELSGLIRDRLEQVDSALEHLDAAVVLDEKNPGRNPRSAAMRRLNRGAFLRDRGMRNRGIVDLEFAQAELAKVHPTYNEMRGLCDVTLARARGLQGDLDAADKLFVVACEFAREQDSDMLPFWIASHGRFLLEQRKDPKGAYALLSEAIQLQEKKRGVAARFNALGRSQFFARLDQNEDYSFAFRAALALGKQQQAFRFLELARSRSLLDLLARRRLEAIDILAMDDGKGQSLKERSARTGRRAAASYTELAKQRTRRDLKAAEQSSRLGELTQRHRAQRRAQGEVERACADALRNDVRLGVPTATAAMLDRLPAGVSLLQYHVTDHGCWLIRLDGAAKSVAIHELRWPDGKSITSDALGKTVEDFLDRIVGSRKPTRGRAPRTKSGSHEALGRRLFQTLVPESVWKLYGKDDTVYLAPHGALQRLPFEALIVAPGPDAVYWLDRGPAVAYVPSASVLLWCLERREAQAKVKRSRIDVVAVGDPMFDLPRLVHSGHEIASIRAAFAKGDSLMPSGVPTAAQIAAWRSGTESPPRVVSMVREQATLPNLELLAPMARILHVATHQLVGTNKTGTPFNRLALTGDYLGLRDMIAGWSHRLDDCELVVLSACDTHRSEVASRIQDREGVMALPWGIHFAGCPSVIASLWQVEDASTAELMRLFYSRLAAGEKDALHAFTAARRAHRRKHPDPGRWAPFLFLGARGR